MRIGYIRGAFMHLVGSPGIIYTGRADHIVAESQMGVVLLICGSISSFLYKFTVPKTCLGTFRKSDPIY